MAGIAIRTAFALAFLLPPIVRPLDFTTTAPFKSAQLSALGDRMFREARFEDAEAAYSQALAFDPANVRAHLGMGKTAALFSDSQHAAQHYSTAYQLAPRDPDAILAFAGIMQKPAARKTLLANFLAYSRDARAEDVTAKLQIAERLGSDEMASLKSPYQPYRIALFPQGKNGLYLRAEINGRELRLILDTGAAGVVLNASAASSIHLEYLCDAALAGYGTAAPAMARVARAASFEAGGLRIANILLNAAGGNLASGADGLIGLDVFKDFLIRLDAKGRTLQLTPFDRAGGACDDCLRAYRLGSLLLLKAQVNARAEGYFILDSGSPYTVISRKLVAATGPNATFRGAQGDQSVSVPSDRPSLRIGQRRFLGFECALLDTSEISARNGTEIAGAIGFSILRDLDLTIDYRNGLVKLAAPGRK